MSLKQVFLLRRQKICEKGSWFATCVSSGADKKNKPSSYLRLTFLRFSMRQTRLAVGSTFLALCFRKPFQCFIVFFAVSHGKLFQNSLILHVQTARSIFWTVYVRVIIIKTIGNRKGDCAWSCSRGQTQPEKICKSQRTNQCHSLRTFYWFVLCNLQIFSGCVCPLEQLHAQSPFLFPIVFIINLIPFFDISSVLAVPSPRLFGYVLLYFTWATARSQELLFVVLACHALRALDSRCRLRTRRRVCICIGSTRCRGNHMHDHSRFQRDIDDVTGVSLSLSTTHKSHSRTI